MTRAELRVYLADKWPFCGCGSPEEAARSLLRLLRLHPLYDHRQELEEWIPDVGLQMLLLYKLTGDGLAEHGGSVGGGWLKPLGEQVRDALAAEEDDAFEALLDPGYCVHGIDFDQVCEECADEMAAR